MQGDSSYNGSDDESDKGSESGSDSGSDNGSDSGDESSDVDGDGTTIDETDDSEESLECQPSTTPQVTDGSSRYDEETSTTTDFTSASKTNTTLTTVDHYDYTTDTTTLPLTNTTVISYSTSSSTMSSHTSTREMMSTPPSSSGSPDTLPTTQRLVWLVIFPSFLIAIVVLVLIIWFLRKTFRSRNRVQHPSDIEVKVKGLKDDKVKSDVKGHTMEALNYNSNPDKQRDSIPKDNKIELTMRPSEVDQYEEVKDDQISMTNKSSNVSFENDGTSQEYENLNPFYHALEPETQIDLDDAMTSRQNTNYDKLDRNGVHDNKIDHETASGMTYDHPTSHEEAYDLMYSTDG